MTTTLDMMGTMELEIARLTAENARLRGEAKKWCDACGCADGANMALRAEVDVVKRNFAAALAGLEAERGIHVTDLARLTHDAASECGRLRAERDGLLAAAKAAASSLIAVAQWTDDDGDMMSLRAYARNRAAVALAACAPEVKP